MSKNIVWSNIYYMITYAIEELAHMVPDDIQLENCESLDDLLSELMKKSIELLKINEFMSEYDRNIASLGRARGKVLLAESEKRGSTVRGEVICEYNVRSVNNEVNIVIKSAVRLLLEYGRLSDTSIISLREIDDYMSGIDCVDEYSVSTYYEKISYLELPEWYKPAIIVSKLIFEGLMGLDKDGNARLYKLSDTRRLRRIFEVFVRRFYEQEYTNAVTSVQTYELGSRKNILDMLLESNTKALIIDTKWYDSDNYRNNRTNNKRQILDYIISYLENSIKTCGSMKSTYGIILYARTRGNEEVLNRKEIRNLGNEYGKCTIYEKTISLNQSFENIKADLIKLADSVMV